MDKKSETFGFLLGAIAVSCFAFTLPMSRLAVQGLDPVIVGFGRAFLASLIAIVVVVVMKLPLPKRQDLRPLILVGLGVSVVFPYFSSLAMRYLPASHGAIVTGLLPLATAGWIAWHYHERPSRHFWLAALGGSCAVIGYALYAGGGRLHPADGLLLAAVVFGGMGYAEGGQLARLRGGLFVMTWALVIAMPILAIIVVSQLSHLNFQASRECWFAFAYLCLISQYAGMIVWYKALSMGSIARLSQVQLLQPFLTVMVAHVFFHEHVMVLTYIAAVMVLVCVLVARQSKVRVKG